MNVTAREFIKEQIKGLEAALKIAERVEVETTLYLGKGEDEIMREVYNEATKTIESMQITIKKLRSLLEKSKE